MDILYPYGGAFVAPFVAAYVASILCRVQAKRGSQSGWRTVLASLVFGIVAACRAHCE
jgi:uncharacterized protein YqgC (DUF456 family)